MIFIRRHPAIKPSDIPADSVLALKTAQLPSNGIPLRLAQRAESIHANGGTAAAQLALQIKLQRLNAVFVGGGKKHLFAKPVRQSPAASGEGGSHFGAARVNRPAQTPLTKRDGLRLLAKAGGKTVGDGFQQRGAVFHRKTSVEAADNGGVFRLQGKILQIIGIQKAVGKGGKGGFR